MENLEERIAKIEERNKTVEADKKWETSWTRMLLIVSLTYVVVGTFLTNIHVDRPWISAIVPALGFTLSTLSLSLARKLWSKRRG